MSYIKWLWAKYLGLALPIRLLLGGVISGLGGSGLVGFLSEYAAYSYAVFYGIRPPLEGIPYLRVAVTTATLVVFMGSAALFLLVVAFARFLILYGYHVVRLILMYIGLALTPLRWLRRYIPAVRSRVGRRHLELPEPKEFVKKHLVSRPARQIVLIALLLALILGSIAAFDEYNRTGETAMAVIQGAGAGAVIVVMILLLWRPELVSLFATLGTAISLCLLLLPSFTPPRTQSYSAYWAMAEESPSEQAY